MNDDDIKKNQNQNQIKPNHTSNQCCFHPILVAWFLVVFGDEVTKILCNSLFIFYFVLPVLPCKWKTSYRKSRNLFSFLVTLSTKTKNEKWDEKLICELLRL